MHLDQRTKCDITGFQGSYLTPRYLSAVRICTFHTSITSSTSLCFGRNLLQCEMCQNRWQEAKAAVKRTQTSYQRSTNVYDRKALWKAFEINWIASKNISFSFLKTIICENIDFVRFLSRFRRRISVCAEKPRQNGESNLKITDRYIKWLIYSLLGHAVADSSL